MACATVFSKSTASCAEIMHKREQATRSLPSFRNITIDRNEMLLDSGVVLSLRIAAACVGCVEQAGAAIDRAIEQLTL